MAVTPFDSAIFRDLYTEPEIAALFSDSAEIRAMLLVEAGLARVQGRLGLIPEAAAEAIAKAAPAASIPAVSLAAGTASAGVPAPALVAALRATLPDEAAAWVHYGATSQDVIDTGLMLRLRRALDHIDERLERLIGALGALAAAEATTVMAARTRGQIATPTTFGARVAVWRAPLVRCRERIAQARPRALMVSLAGASGTLAAMGPKGAAVAAALAEEFALAYDPTPWHAARDGIAEIGGLAALITGALGKIGRDAQLLLQSEVREISAGKGGGSSTMPHKANPVGAEALAALARTVAGLSSRLYDAMLHEHERDGVAWATEWFTLPQMIVATGAALAHAEKMISALTTRPEAMRATMEATGGLMMAEAAVFALASHMPRPEADRLLKAAAAEALSSGEPLASILSRSTDAPVDWPAVLDPANYVGAAPAIARSAGKGPLGAV